MRSNLKILSWLYFKLVECQLGGKFWTWHIMLSRSILSHNETYLCDVKYRIFVISDKFTRRMKVHDKNSPIPLVCEAEIFTVAIIIPEKSKNNLTPRLREYRKPMLHRVLTIILLDLCSLPRRSFVSKYRWKEIFFSSKCMINLSDFWQLFRT